MAYKALYRKYRPQSFDEVVGQQHVVSTLRNAVETGKLAHAYLFCGPRGTGKTSIAKILAKTINCEAEKKPCGKCSNCIDIQESNHPDIIELDAASNNGVDEVREIIEKVKYAPMHGKYKVYIIDEVHMMTASAFNALLKTLEEPPEYCVFILATTEVHKVLPTIISRCQRFDFKKIPVDNIKEYLISICKAENISYDDEALALIASLADGGMRDSLSILDQCYAYSPNHISVEDVSMVYGVVSLQEKLNIFDLIDKKDSQKLVEEVNQISQRGIDIQRITTDLIDIAKETVVYSYCKNKTVLQILDEEQVNKLLKMFSSTQLLTYIDYLIETQSRYKDAINAFAYFEVCLLKMVDYQPNVNRPIVSQPSKEKESPIQKKETVKIDVDKHFATATNDFDPSAIPVCKELSDDQIYNILTSANKELKKTAGNMIAAIDLANVEQTKVYLIEYLKAADIFACSNSDIIVTVSDRSVATRINEISNNAIIKEIIKKANLNKDVYAITTDQRDYLITYFKSRQNQKPVESAPIQSQEKDLDATIKMQQLFGKDGFDIVED